MWKYETKFNSCRGVALCLWGGSWIQMMETESSDIDGIRGKRRGDTIRPREM